MTLIDVFMDANRRSVAPLNELTVCSVRVCVCVCKIDDVKESQRCVSSNREHMKRTYYHILESEILEEVKNGKALRTRLRSLL